MSHWAGTVKPTTFSSIQDIQMSKDLTDEIIHAIWNRLLMGDHQHLIAADYRINQGRVSEIKTGKRGGHITGLGTT